MTGFLGKLEQWMEVMRRGRLLGSGILAGMATVLLMLCYYSITRQSVTADEYGHLPMGHNILLTADMRYCSFHPPLMNMASALPLLLIDAVPACEPSRYYRAANWDFWRNGEWFAEKNTGNYHRLYEAARWMTVLVLLVLGAAAFRWARESGGYGAGFLAAGLTWFSPNMLAHGTLVTTDTGLTLVMVLALWQFTRFLRHPAWREAVLSGLTLGIAQLVKAPSLFLYAILPGAAFLWLVRRDRRLPTLADLRPLVSKVVVIFLISLLVLNAGFLFEGTFSTPRHYALRSPAMQQLFLFIPPRLPIPIPVNYVLALDAQLVDSAKGYDSYLLGESYHGGRWYYFIVLLALKTPIAWHLLLVLAMILGIRTRRAFRFESIFLLFSAGFILVMFSCFTGKQIGVRMVMAVEALVSIWIATMVGPSWRSKWGAAAAVLGAWLFVSSVSCGSDRISYFNEWAGGPDRGYRSALDSNFDWGQDLIRLREWMEREGVEEVPLAYFGAVDPAIYGIKYHLPGEGPSPGWKIVSASLTGLKGMAPDHGRRVEVVPQDVPPEALLGRIGRTLLIVRD